MTSNMHAKAGMSTPAITCIAFLDNLLSGDHEELAHEIVGRD